MVLLRLFFNGAWVSENNKGDIGVVIRNENGEVMGAKASSINIEENSFCVEAKAMVSAMIFALEMSFTDVEFEGDALTVIKKMQEGEADFSTIWNDIEEARNRVSTFRNCSFKHVGRKGNEAANKLAKYGMGIASENVSVKECPSLLENIIANDICL